MFEVTTCMVVVAGTADTHFGERHDPNTKDGKHDRYSCDRYHIFVTCSIATTTALWTGNMRDFHIAVREGIVDAGPTSRDNRTRKIGRSDPLCGWDRSH